MICTYWLTINRADPYISIIGQKTYLNDLIIPRLRANQRLDDIASFDETGPTQVINVAGVLFRGPYPLCTCSSPQLNHFINVIYSHVREEFITAGNLNRLRIRHNHMTRKYTLIFMPGTKYLSSSDIQDAFNFTEEEVHRNSGRSSNSDVISMDIQ